MERDPVSDLREEVLRLSARIAEIEQLLRARPIQEQPPPRPVEPMRAAAPPQPIAPTPPPSPPPPPPPMVTPPRAEAGDLEAEIGGNWLNRIGAVALVLGMAFFLQYAIANRWINETARIVIGIVIGLACIFGGEHFQKRGLGRYAQGLSGAGIAILYFSIYAAFAFYQLIPQLPAFGFMILVTVTAIAVSVRYDAIVIAILGIIGGFLTPVLMQKPGGGEGDSMIRLFTYVAILDLGILGTTYYKNWRALNLLSLAGTVMLFAGGSVPEKLGVTMLFLTIFYVIFAAQSFVQNVLAKRPMNSADLLMVIATPILYFATSYYLLRPDYYIYLGLFTVVIGAVYLIFANRVEIVGYEDRSLRLLFLCIAAGFLIVAVPIQLKQHWITIGWAAEAAIIAWIGFYVGSARTRYVAAGLFGLVGMRLLFFDTWTRMLGNQVLVPFFNARFAAFLFAIGMGVLVLWLYSRHRDRTTDAEKVIQVILVLGANFLMIWALSVEVLCWLSTYQLAYQGAESLALSAVWAFYAAIMLAVGIAIRYRPARIMAMIVLGVVILKSFLVDVWTLEKLYRIIAFVGLGVLLLAASYVYQIQRDRIRRIIGVEGDRDAT